MIWSNRVSERALMAMAAWGVTRADVPRISATMIWLPSPFIFKKGTSLNACFPADLRRHAALPPYMAELGRNCQSAAGMGGPRPGQGRHHGENFLLFLTTWLRRDLNQTESFVVRPAP